MAKRSRTSEEALAGLVSCAAALTLMAGPWELLQKVFGILGVAAALVLALLVIRSHHQPAIEPRMRREPRIPDSQVCVQPRKDNFVEVLTPSEPIRGEQLPSWSIQLIRDLEWKRLEELCEGYWRAKDYRAELTGRGSDGGIDIKLYRPSDPGKLLAVIQCKSRSRDNIGLSTIRELYGVMHHEHAPMGILITSSDFHTSVREFAAGKHIQLVNGETMLDQLLDLPAEVREALLAQATRGDYMTPTCPGCETKMVWRPVRHFYGCTNFPQCLNKLYKGMERRVITQSDER